MDISCISGLILQCDFVYSSTGLSAVYLVCCLFKFIVIWLLPTFSFIFFVYVFVLFLFCGVAVPGGGGKLWLCPWLFSFLKYLIFYYISVHGCIFHMF